MLDYKDIITKHCALGMTGSAIAETLGVSKSGVNDFLRAFKACKDLKYPLPKGITNYGIAAVVYPRKPTTHVGRDVSYELPDYEAVSKDRSSFHAGNRHNQRPAPSASCLFRQGL